jgi:hypothetical protein
MIIYSGPSMLDGAPIVAIATAATKNTKTGPMVQVWILRFDMDPMAASKAGLDASVCGQCPLRWSLGGACYVTIFQAPLSVYRAYKRGRYDAGGKHERKIVRALAAGVPVRLGAYGDPAAVPIDVWARFLARTPHAERTGYTHQWRDPRFHALRHLVMASCDSPDDLARANAEGWRGFVVLRDGVTPPPRTIECLSEARATSCADCKACDGVKGRDTLAASVWIRVHGARANRFALPVVR